jgi:hypothetical protein
VIARFICCSDDTRVAQPPSAVVWRSLCLSPRLRGEIFGVRFFWLSAEGLMLPGERAAIYGREKEQPLRTCHVERSAGAHRD